MSARAMPPHSGPAPPDEDRGQEIQSIFWAFTSISIVMVTLRFYTRIKIRGIGWDDWMMLITLVLLLVQTSMVTYLTSIGGARHVMYLNETEVGEALRWSWFVQPPAIMIFATSKTAIAIFLLRVIRQTCFWRRNIIWAVIAMVFIVNILTIIITYVQCTPSRRLWTPNMEGKCWDPKIEIGLNTFFGACNILADVTLAILPMTFIPNLAMPKRRKIALCVLLGFGIVAGGMGAVKTYYLANTKHRSDFTWDEFPLHIWSAAESFVLIFCANLPPLQPLYAALVSGKKLGAFNDDNSAYRHGSHSAATKGSIQKRLNTASDAKPSSSRDHISMEDIGHTVAADDVSVPKLPRGHV